MKCFYDPFECDAGWKYKAKKAMILAEFNSFDANVKFIFGYFISPFIKDDHFGLIKIHSKAPLLKI